VGPSARHIQAEPLVEWWRGQTPPSSNHGTNSSFKPVPALNFRIGSFAMTAESPELTDLRMEGVDAGSGLAIDLKLHRCALACAVLLGCRLSLFLSFRSCWRPSVSVASWLSAAAWLRSSSLSCAVSCCCLVTCAGSLTGLTRRFD
jgi:hypothetical protein